MRYLTTSIVGLLLLTFFTTNTGTAAVFKWVDEQGVTHYSAAPPANRKGEQVKTQPAPAVPEETNEQSSMKNWAATEELRASKNRREQQEAAETQEKSERMQKCTLARQRLDILLKQGRIYKLNEAGEKVFYDDDFHDAETVRMKEAVRKYCRS
ncbi:MAG: DUF4124 domain-containing protein [Nitrosomonadales bacterium]|nr:DUF4124 domain-containing protein [Nitrosomonadales bacterium]